MDWQQKFVALKAIDSDVALLARGYGNWYLRFSPEIGEPSILRSPTQAGKDPEEAVDQAWKEYSTAKRVVINAYSAKRRAVKWNGFMWEEVVEAQS